MSRKNDMTPFYMHFAPDGRKRVLHNKVPKPKEGTYYSLSKADWKKLQNSKYKLILEDGGFTVVTRIPQASPLAYYLVVGCAFFALGFLLGIATLF
jgi:diphthamide synthase subunit DPH2